MQGRALFRMPHRLTLYRTLCLIVVIAMLLAGCDMGGSAPAATPVQTAASQAPEPSPTTQAASGAAEATPAAGQASQGSNDGATATSPATVSPTPATLQGSLSFLAFGE